MDSQCPSGSAPPEPSVSSFLGFPMPFRLTKTAVCDYAELAGVTEAEAITELERRAVDATKVREQETGLARYRLKGSRRTGVLCSHLAHWLLSKGFNVYGSIRWRSG